MLDGLSASCGGSLSEATIGLRRFARRDRTMDMARPPHQIGTAAPTFAMTRGISRLAAAGAIAANGQLPLMVLWKVAVVADGAPVRYAALAAAATLALHLRHVAFGLRDERPPAGGWTLAVLAIVNIAASVLVGRTWAVPFASIAVSVLIVVRGPAALALVAAIAFLPLLFAHTPLPAWRLSVDPLAMLPEQFLVLAVVWWTAILYVPVRLVAIIQRLETARRSLESRAVIQTRSRIEGELRNGLELALQRIIAGGKLAHQATARDPTRASAELQALVKDSRRALADARRIAAGYRMSSLRAELEAAMSLLQAAGSTCRLVVAPNLPVDAAGTGSSGAIRAAVVRAFDTDEQQTASVIHVGLDEAGELRVEVTP
jgi:two-component system, NarL family, sensor histidine kinase DesK